MLTVIKFGGSSLATTEKIDNAARIAAGLRQEGNQVVMVVSAQGDTTDELLKKADEVCENQSPRELDVLLAIGEQASMALMAMHLSQLGVPAVSLCGWQAGILTDSNYGIARIQQVFTKRIEKELAEGKIVVVAGFQGITADEDITTIGRGGSDTTAVALAAAMHADSCRIYTDVDGVYSADPRIVKNAFRHREISYDEMLEMASLGAGVLHNRSVELAKKRGVRLRVLSSFESTGGTEVCDVMEGRRVTGVACDKNTALVQVLGGGMEALPQIFEKLAEKGIVSDMITHIDNRLGLTVHKNKAKLAVAEISALAEKLNLVSVSEDSSYVKVSAVGCGMGSDPRVAARLLSALAAAGVKVKSMVAGEIKISVLVAVQDADRAVLSVHNEFFGEKA